MDLKDKCKKNKTDNIHLESEYILIVEGKDECYLINRLLKKMGLQDKIQIMNVVGVKKIKPTLKAITFLPEFSSVKAVGIIRDADKNAQDAFKSISNALKFCDFPTPNKMLSIAKEEDKPAVSVMILPDCKSPGTLEDLVLASLEDDPAISCIEIFFKCLDNTKNLEKPKYPKKAKLQAFFSSRKYFIKDMGIAAQKDYFDWNHKAFDQIKDFLIQVSGI